MFIFEADYLFDYSKLWIANDLVESHSKPILGLMMTFSFKLHLVIRDLILTCSDMCQMLV